jgi:hypothetical protein
MALTPEQKKLLEELTAKANEPEADDFEVEIYNEHGRGMRLPLSRATDWIKDNFGIGRSEETPAPEETPTEEIPAKQGAYFGRGAKK